jgi:ferredoxin-NADP reductase
VATIREVRTETPDTKTLVLDVPDWPGHAAGQHVDVRLTAEDGYQAQRGYSISSAPGNRAVELTVERIDDGEVSPYLTEEVRPGDQFELRGPIGGYFVWHEGLSEPLLLVGGGAGLAPLMAMLRHHRNTGSEVETRLLLSARTFDDVLYRDELERLAGGAVSVHITLTRGQAPPGWDGWTRRIDSDMLAAVGPGPERGPRIYVCGPTPFEMAEREGHTDGNAIAGLLQEVFVAEMTTAGRVCQSCGQDHPIGAHRHYEGAGHVLRCPGCGDLAATIAVLPDRYVIGLHGAWSLARAE